MTNTTPRSPRPVFGLPPVPVCAYGVARAYLDAIRTPSTDPAPAPRDRSF